MADLKPCPFCGGAMRIEGNRDTHKLLGAHDENCIFDTDDHVVQVPATDEQLQFMVSDWNRRATEAEATGKHGAVKDHEITAAVNEIAIVARAYHDTQQLRARISRIVAPLLSRAAPSATVDVAASGEAVQADLNANGVHEPKEGMHLDAEDVQFLATRLRRLFARFNYPLPKFADDGRRLIGIAPSCIGAVLANLDAAEVSSVPEGYALVPKEPTAEMQHAAALAVRFKTTPLNRIWIGNAAYRAAVAAAPTPTVSDDGARAKKTYTVRNGDGSTALVDDWWVYFDADGTARVGGAVVTVLSVKDNNAS